MDFYQIRERTIKNGAREVYPDFTVGRSRDIMVRGKSFYAIWDEEAGMWSTDEYDVPRLVDAELAEYRANMTTEDRVTVRYLKSFSSKAWLDFKKFVNSMSDNSVQLDNKVIFANSEVKKKDYASRRLSYSIGEGSTEAYDELIGTLYNPEERQKIEWAIGAVISGDARKIQKFIVLFGEAGTGKSTVLNIIQKLFDGYYTMFEAKELASSNNEFSTEVFRSNPLVAIQHDGDLSKIEDNTKLNSIIAHEEMVMKEKYKPAYTSRANCFLFMATNKPVKITDSMSGVLRRLIDVRPSGNKVSAKRYNALIEQIDFELGAIAQHCLDVYLELGKNYYNNYRPIDMQLRTDVFYNFVEEQYFIFKEQDGTTLKAAYEAYKQYCDEALITYKLPMYKFREELKNYFKEFKDVVRIDGKQVRSYYSGFLYKKFDRTMEIEKDEPIPSLSFERQDSIFDTEFENCPAQYTTKNETPVKKWDEVDTVLADLNTKRLHYVKVPDNLIVIDFDLKDENGEKSLEANLDAASKWPSTYAELSKSGKGVHLHYIYEGDPDKLSRLYSEGIEVKVFKGNSSLRRKLTKCNSTPIAKINSGLPLKGGKTVVNFESVKSEKALRTIIKKSLNKEYEPHATKPSIDFIFKVLEDAYNDGLNYDVRDLKPSVISFAANSSHNADYCLKKVTEMKFSSEEASASIGKYKSDKYVFFDVEVFPNLFVVVWKMEGKDPIKMINPTPIEIEDLLRFKLVGFNNRRYDNHILYARLVGYDNEQLFRLSQRIIDGHRTSMFGEAYNLSFADVYDFSSKKQSLKKFEIELGLHHQELGLPWNKPVPEELWETVADYCVNDVIATEAVFNARKQDFVAREVLADISGLSVNDTTQMHTAKIIFGNDPRPQSKFVYTDLSEMFPGYTFEAGHSSYRGEDPGEGGYVYAEPGMYTNVALLDIASMHPNSLINLNAFGPYTENFKQLLDARLAIKHKDFDSARKMLGGALAPYLEDEEQANDLSYALKIVINSVYGLTSAKFDCKFKDPRNVDNIVAKRGALFMVDLKFAVQNLGYTVAHIKTDSIKIPDADEEIISFVMDMGKKYGYTFEHEATYEKFCLVNNAVYIAKYGTVEHCEKLYGSGYVHYFPEICAKNKKHPGDWEATGAQFQVPYVFKTLFSHEPIEFRDLCETKTVTSALYLDMNEDLDEGMHDYHFVGRAGLFCPMLPGSGGGILLRETKDGGYAAATGTKGYRWMEAEMVKELGKESEIDESYYKHLVDEAVREISLYGDFEWFVED